MSLPVSEPPTSESGPSDSPLSFRDLITSPELLSSLERLGFTTPTPVQRETLPAAIAGRDVIAQAKTGSGKTLAYVLPLLSQLQQMGSRPGTYGIILAPTRELANQICEVIRSVAPEVSPACIIGGISSKAQIQDLARDRRVVVGTPGRILDLLEQREILLRSCRFFTVDEVDEMFSMDFVEDVRKILSRLPPERQGMFISATVTPRVEMLAGTFLRDPVKVIINSPAEAAPLIDHTYCSVGGEVTAKVTALCDLIETRNPRSAIIFCNTKSDTELVEVYLRRRGYDARLLNSDLNQRQRDAIVALIRAEKLRFLVGTDIAARGLDIDHIDLVVNYALPDQHESYVHRSGRTARAGRHGTAISLIGPQDFAAFRDIRRHLPLTFTEIPLPTEQDVLEARSRHITQLVESMPAERQPRELAVAEKVIAALAPGQVATPELIAMTSKLCRSLLEYQAMLAHKAAAEETSGVNLDRSPPREERSGDSHRGGGRGHSHDRRRRDRGDRGRGRGGR